MRIRKFADSTSNAFRRKSRYMKSKLTRKRSQAPEWDHDWGNHVRVEARQRWLALNPSNASRDIGDTSSISSMPALSSTNSNRSSVFAEKLKALVMGSSKSSSILSL